jgi:hypothetical protein
VPLFSTELTDGNHRRKLHIPTRPMSEKPLLPMEYPSVITDGNYRRIKTKGGIFKNFGAHFNLFPVGIADENKCHRQHLMFRR